jgi:hypothetical protein
MGKYSNLHRTLGPKPFGSKFFVVQSCSCWLTSINQQMKQKTGKEVSRIGTAKLTGHFDLAVLRGYAQKFKNTL